MCRHEWTPRSWKQYRCPRCGAWDYELKAEKDKREAEDS